jgi:excisionase family DNA binding protein
LASDSAQFVLPFLAEPTEPCAEIQASQAPSLPPLLPEPPAAQVVPPRGSTTQQAAKKSLRPAKARQPDRITPATLPGRPMYKHIVRADKRLPAATTDSFAVSPNIVALIEGRSEAWSARELAKLIGCTGKHIYALAKNGRMPHLRIGGMVRFDPATTAEWLRQRYIAA